MFSQLKLIKTKIRNRLSEDTLDSLLRIAVEGSSPQDYPIQEAVELWAKKKQTATIINTQLRDIYVVYKSWLRGVFCIYTTQVRGQRKFTTDKPLSRRRGVYQW